MVLKKNNEKRIACFSAKEIALLIVSKFFKNLSNSILPSRDDVFNIAQNIKALADHSVDSHDYEYFVAVLVLYIQFNKKCNFCFYLKSTFDIKTTAINSLDDLARYTDDPPDVIIEYEKNYYEFELKRYRGELTFESLFDFVDRKILKHYSGKQNFLIFLQPPPFSEISENMFIDLHKKLTSLAVPGIVGFSLNSNNEETITFQVFPKLHKFVHKLENEKELFAEILHSD